MSRRLSDLDLSRRLVSALSVVGSLRKVRPAGRRAAVLVEAAMVGSSRPARGGNSTSSMDRQGLPGLLISSVLYRPLIVSASALS